MQRFFSVNELAVQIPNDAEDVANCSEVARSPAQLLSRLLPIEVSPEPVRE